jgi:ATP synthase protein I
MQSSDARILRGAAIPTCLAGLAAAIVCGTVAGSEGVIAAVMGTALVMVFFSISLVAVAYAGRISPQAMMPAALGSYVLKLLVIYAALAALKNVTIWHPRSFAWTVLALTLVWVFAEARGLIKSKMLYVDDPQDPANSASNRRADG